MAERRRGRRWIEWGKDVLIVLLLCSAVYLAGRTPVYSRIRNWIATQPQPVQSTVHLRRDEIQPCLICVRGPLGLFGVGYDADQTRRVFEEFSPLLGEALSTAGEAQTVGSVRWRSLLEMPGACFFFQGEPPFSVLSALLNDGEGQAPSGGASQMLLAWDGETLWLGWREGAEWYCAPTQLSYEGSLEDLLADYNPNGAAYAYALAKEDRAYSALDPYAPVLLSTPSPQVYTAYSPDLVRDREALEELLDALSFRSGVGSAYETSGELALNEGGDRLRLGSDGSVFFRAGEETRYPVAGPLTAAQAALRSWELLDLAYAPWKGEDTQFSLAQVQETEGGWRVCFQTSLAGVPLRAGEWTAVFTVTERGITEFSLRLTQLTAAGAYTLLPSPRLAAAAVRSLAGDGQLTLGYTVSGGIAQAAWLTGSP